MIKLSEGGIADMWRSEKTPEIESISFALQKAVERVCVAADQTKCFSDIDSLSESTLDYFAVEMRALYYSQSLPIEQKRAIIKNTLNWYTKAGTPAAVAEMVDVVLGGGRVIEWYDFDEEPALPGTFDIATSARLTSDIMTALVGLIKKIKNVRSHVRRVLIERNLPSGQYAAGWCFSPQMSIVPNILLGDYVSESGVSAGGLLISPENTMVDNQIALSAETAGGTYYAATEAHDQSSVVFNQETIDAEAAASSAAVVGAIQPTATSTFIK